MLEFAYPWLFALLLAPLLMRLLPPRREPRDAVRVPFFAALVDLSEQQPRRGAAVLRRDRLQKLLVLLTWLCLVLAVAKPEWVGQPIEQQRSGRDLMIAVDLSGSMATEDFSQPDGAAVDRLTAVKTVLETLAGERNSDRLGLIVFGNAAYLQVPFTDDHAVWQQLLEETEIGMAGQSTVFGDAIGLAIKLFSESPSDNQVLIVLTDGNDTGSVVPPVEAAKVAANAGIRIYTIAMGDPATVGEEALDIETLRRVSQISGGRYFQALAQTELADAYRVIGELEPELYETVSFSPRESLHHWPVGLAALLYLLYHLWQAAWGPRVRA